MEESEGLALDEFLSRLYQCGETAVNETKDREGKAKLKGRKCKQKKNEEQALCPEVQPVPCSTALPTTSDSLAKTVANSPHRIPKCLVKLHAELLNSMADCAVQAKAKGENNGSVTNGEKGPVEVVTFTGSRKRKKPAIDEDQVEETVEQNTTQQKVFNLERARLEVHRFGITGYKKEQQRVFERERAIMLGARPPKREYVNYKSYQETIKNKAAAKLTKMNSKSTLPKRKKEERRNRKSEIVPTGQVGRFKNGALILSDSDIKRIKTTKSKHM
ncbi:40S small subunit processome assembly factor 1 [Mustelus asterias]